MDCILTSMMARQAAKYGSKEALSFINESGEIKEALSFDSLLAHIDKVACAIETLGVMPGDFCLIFSANRPEMIITDFACYHNGAIPVSVYSTSSQDQVEYIVRDCRPKLIFTGDDAQYKIAMAVKDNCPWVQQVLKFSEFDQLLGLGSAASDLCRAEVEKRRQAVKPTDIATLIYTSGTTGEPKGAVLTHDNFNAVVRIHNERLTMLSDNDTSLCFLPLSHIFEKAWTYYCISMGMHIAINENPKEIAKTIQHVRPTCMCSVPRFWEKVYSGINDKVSRMPWLKRKMIRMALKIGKDRNLNYARLGKKAPLWLEWLYQRFDHSVFYPVRRLLGIDKGNIFPTAGAPISANIVEFMHAMGVNIVVGYGLSETTATVTCFPQVGYIIGSVGTVMPELEVSISDVGEILVKGPTVMREYYNQPKATEEAFTKDGWFRTGDAGYFDEAGALVLTERIKDLFKTSNGKYIAPQAIESRLGEDRYIEQVAVVGESRKYVTAIIIPAFEALKEYARRKQIAFKNLDDLIHNSEIIKLIQERIEKLQKGMPSFEQIKKFTLLPKAFTIESGELTNTLKIRRPIINSHYAKEIDAMYA